MKNVNPLGRCEFLDHGLYPLWEFIWLSKIRVFNQIAVSGSNISTSWIGFADFVFSLCDHRV